MFLFFFYYRDCIGNSMWLKMQSAEVTNRPKSPLVITFDCRLCAAREDMILPWSIFKIMSIWKLYNKLGASVKIFKGSNKHQTSTFLTEYLGGQRAKWGVHLCIQTVIKKGFIWSGFSIWKSADTEQNPDCLNNSISNHENTHPQSHHFPLWTQPYLQSAWTVFN